MTVTKAAETYHKLNPYLAIDEAGVWDSRADAVEYHGAVNAVKNPDNLKYHSVFWAPDLQQQIEVLKRGFDINPVLRRLTFEEFIKVYEIKVA